jgi:hypothetical protein
VWIVDPPTPMCGMPERRGDGEDRSNAQGGNSFEN